jgi:hypothetical protein
MIKNPDITYELTKEDEGSKEDNVVCNIDITH